MDNSISPAGPGGAQGGAESGAPSQGSQKDQFASMLESVKINPGDEKILNTPYAKMLLKYAGPNMSENDRIRYVKKSQELMFDMVNKEIQRQQQHLLESIKKMRADRPE